MKYKSWNSWRKSSIYRFKSFDVMHIFMIQIPISIRLRLKWKISMMRMTFLQLERDEGMMEINRIYHSRILHIILRYIHFIQDIDDSIINRDDISSSFIKIKSLHDHY